MSEARTFSYYHGEGRNALLYDIASTVINWGPGTMRDLESVAMMVPHLSYVYTVSAACKGIDLLGLSEEAMKRGRSDAGND